MTVNNDDTFSTMTRLARCRATRQPVSWHPLDGTTLRLTTAHPLNDNNAVTMSVTASKSHGGIANIGYWGIPLVEGSSYHVSVYLKGDVYVGVRLGVPVCQSSTFAFVPGLWGR
jgi:hypothetical protein